MVVADIKPLGLPVLVQFYQLVAQVLVGSVFTHLDSGTFDYSRVQLRLQSEEFAEQDLVGLDTHKSLAEMNEDGDVEDSIRVEIEVLNTIVPEHALEEITGRQRQSTFHEPNEHQIWIAGGSAPQIHILLPKKSVVEC
jgi:hypothetical protein